MDIAYHIEMIPTDRTDYEATTGIAYMDWCLGACGWIVSDCATWDEAVKRAKNFAAQEGRPCSASIRQVNRKGERYKPLQKCETYLPSGEIVHSRELHADGTATVTHYRNGDAHTATGKHDELFRFFRPVGVILKADPRPIAY